MQVNQLRYFVRTAQELHFARAAARLGISQPSLSRGIQALEKELGVALFQRTNKWQVSLTAAGEAFLPEAIKVLHQLSYAEERAHSAGQGECGHLAIGAISSTLGRRCFINALAEMRRTRPGVAVEVIDSDSNGLTGLMRERTLDLALMRHSLAVEEDDELCSEVVYDDPLALVLPRTHFLAQQKELKVQDLANERFILVPDRSAPEFRNYIFRFCELQGGFTPQLAGEIGSSYTALRLTEAGLGITVVSSTYIGMFQEQLCYRKLQDFQPHLPVLAVWVEDNNSPPLHYFLQLLRKHSTQEEPPLLY